MAGRARPPAVGLLVTQQHVGDDAGGDSDQHIIAADLHPVLAARWRAQMMAAPVVDHVLVAAIFGRDALAAHHVVARAGTARAVVVDFGRMVVVAVVAAFAVVVVVVLGLRVVVAVVAVIVMVLREGGGAAGQHADSSQCGN